MIKYLLFILLVSLPVYSQEKATSIHFDVIYQSGMEKCAYYLINYLEKNYKTQSENFKFEINDPVRVNISSGNSAYKNNFTSDSIDIRFSGSYVESGKVAAFQLACIFFDKMKKDPLLVNKTVIKEIPAWIKKGYCLYLSSEEKDYFQENDSVFKIFKHDFEFLKLPDSDKFPDAALSFFNFLERNFNNRISAFFIEAFDSGADDAFKSVYGKTGDELIAMWSGSLKNEGPADADKTFNKNFLFNKDSEVVISPDGASAAILEKSFIKIRNLPEGSEFFLYSNPSIQRGTLAWKADSMEICFAEYKNNGISVLSINVKTGKVHLLFSQPFHKISEMRVYPGEKFIFTGSSLESSDIYIFDKPAGKLTRITADCFDKKFPVVSESNILLFFSNENPFQNPFSSRYSLFMYDLNSREKIQLSGNVNFPSGITFYGKDRAAVSYKMNAIDSIYAVNLKSAVLKASLQPGYGPVATADGTEIFYFKNLPAGKLLMKSNISIFESEFLKEITRDMENPSEHDKLFPQGEVFFNTD